MVAPGVYIVRSIENFFLVTLEEYEKAYIIKCVPTASKDDHSTFDDANFPISCVDMMVTKKGSVSRFYLHNLSFESSCSLGGGLEHGDGTEELLMCMLGFCYKILQVEVTAWFYFLDASEIKCDNTNISLRDYGLLVKGSTWYQRRLGAIATAESQKKLEKYTTVLTETIFLQKDADNLVQVLRVTNEVTSKKKAEYTKMLKGCVGKTWREMLFQINGEQAQTGCSFFCDDVVDFILSHLDLEYVVHFEIGMNKKMANEYVKGFKIIYNS